MDTIGLTDSTSLLRQVNLNHLVYFWAVARCGSFTGASAQLGVSQPSISEQVRALETRLGQALLIREGRGVSLTPAGRRALRFAEEIVGVCSEMVRSLPFEAHDEATVLAIGTSDAVPKIVVRTILAPLLTDSPPCAVVCREWRTDHLLSELALHRLDLVICDSPITRTAASKLISFRADRSDITFCGTPATARKLKRGFPRSLADAPLLMPTTGLALRSALDRWLVGHRIRPKVVVEAEDRALLHHFAESGHGVVPVASATLKDVCRQFGLAAIGPARGVVEEYFVVFVDRPNGHTVVDRLRQRLTTQYSALARRSEHSSGASHKAIRRAL